MQVIFYFPSEQENTYFSWKNDFLEFFLEVCGMNSVNSVIIQIPMLINLTVQGPFYVEYSEHTYFDITCDVM